MGTSRDRYEMVDFLTNVYKDIGHMSNTTKEIDKEISEKWLYEWRQYRRLKREARNQSTQRD